MSKDKYSVIMTTFEGDWRKLEEAVPEIFGRDGLDVFTLVVMKEMPSEVADDLSRDDASRILLALEAVGAKTQITLTWNVTGVMHRADELWAARKGEHFVFTEIDGMIFSLGACNARQNLEHIRPTHGERSSWTYERSLNHYHVDIGPVRFGLSRETIREGNKVVSLLKKDLETCYPDRRFIIAHDLGSIVSYYQPTEGAPTETIPVEDRDPEKAFCPR